jgi:hypothetical protein
VLIHTLISRTIFQANVRTNNSKTFINLLPIISQKKWRCSLISAKLFQILSRNLALVYKNKNTLIISSNLFATVSWRERRIRTIVNKIWFIQTKNEWKQMRPMWKLRNWISPKVIRHLWVWNICSIEFVQGNQQNKNSKFINCSMKNSAPKLLHKASFDIS